MTAQERRLKNLEKRNARQVIDVFPDPVEEALDLEAPPGSDSRSLKRLRAEIAGLAARVEALIKLRRKVGK